MEENKNVNVAEKAETKMSYEELERLAFDLNRQRQQLYVELQNTNMENAFKRLDYLFKVVEYNKHFPTNFFNNCIEEIVEMMTLRVEDNKEE